MGDFFDIYCTLHWSVSFIMIETCHLLLIILFSTCRTVPDKWHVLNKYLFIKSRKVMSDFRSQSNLSITLFLLLQFPSLVPLSNLKPLSFFRIWLKSSLLNKAFSECFSSNCISFFWTSVSIYHLFHLSGTQSYFFLIC